MTKTTKILKTTLKILTIILDVILILVIVINLYNLAAQKLFGVRNPTFLGITSAVVDTGSMKGDNPDSFDGNAFIVTFKKRSYEVGDIISFDTGGTKTTTHRIVGIEPEGYVTQGDANNTADDWRVPDEAVVGKVILIIHGGGTVIKYLRSPAGLTALAIVMVLIFALPYILGKASDEDREN
ncbi:MAG: signal peptidase I [Clostridia bacterium]|nr:signal peptidase I [Clostridia bacterium]